MRTRLSSFLIVLAALTLVSGQGGPPQPTFRTGANYVRVDMYASANGVAVRDLRADEVEVLEDGVPQEIRDFEYVQVRPASQAAVQEPGGLRESREAARDPRARVFVVFLDTYHTQLDGSANVRRPLTTFLDRVLGPDDLVALMTPEMAGSDIALGRKTDVIAAILSEEWWGRRARAVDQDPKELLYEHCAARSSTRQTLPELIGRRREKLTLDALEDLMVHLTGLREERKAVVVVTEGWLLYRPNPGLGAPAPDRAPAPPAVFQPPVKPPSAQGALDGASTIECEADRNALALVDHETRLRDITEEANRGNVTFYPVYARGLVTFDSPIDQPVRIDRDMANLRTRHDSLRTIAVETDGTAVINTNDIDGSLTRIADDLSSYYLFGYNSTNTRLDGRFRSITVRVTRAGVRVRARRGYRGRTAAEIVNSVAGAPDPARVAVTTALNAVAGINARSSFRIRPSAWTRSDGSGVASIVWLVGELDYRVRKELAWTAGAQAEIVLVSATGNQVASMTASLGAGQGAFGVRLPETGALAPGEYAARVRLRPESGTGVDLTDTARVIVPQKATLVGEAVVWRRGPSTGPQHLRTADLRFQRSERLRLELATAAAAEAPAAARLLDRTGKQLQVPVQISTRSDPGGSMRWIVADAALAPLAPGEYAVEVTLGDESQVTGFRVVP